MATRKATVRFTANSEHNLSQIGTYWAERDAPQTYASLLDEIGSVVVANLECGPDARQAGGDVDQGWLVLCALRQVLVGGIKYRRVRQARDGSEMPRSPAGANISRLSPATHSQAFGASNGFTTFTSKCAKSATLRVTTVSL